MASCPAGLVGSLPVISRRGLLVPRAAALFRPTGPGALSEMWADAEWDDRPVTGQWTAHWFLADGRSLWDLAQRIHSEEGEDGA
ncbi:hypothetical protein [Streptomyces sp. NPDC004629]|uniref:hypothetical protein n=1 Tax=Streptomyces sp. NPDC004629 TaxID=3364705 RepID=UPI0036B40C49